MDGSKVIGLEEKEACCWENNEDVTEDRNPLNWYFFHEDIWSILYYIVTQWTWKAPLDGVTNFDAQF